MMNELFGSNARRAVTGAVLAFLLVASILYLIPRLPLGPEATVTLTGRATDGAGLTFFKDNEPQGRIELSNRR